jgi:monovalent cation/hydrogen antiporter
MTITAAATATASTATAEADPSRIPSTTTGSWSPTSAKSAALRTKTSLLAAQAAIQRLDELAGEPWVRGSTAERMRGVYQFRIRRFSARFDGDDDGQIEEGSLAYQRLRRELLEAEREEIVRLRNRGRINDEIMHRIERDLDLEDTRLEV